MVIRVRNALGRQNNKKIKGEINPQTIEQKMLQVLNGLTGGCYNMNCICQAFAERDSLVLSEQVADIVNGFILARKLRLSRIRLDHGKVTVYFTIVNRKMQKVK